MARGYGFWVNASFDCSIAEIHSFLSLIRVVILQHSMDVSNTSNNADLVPFNVV